MHAWLFGRVSSEQGLSALASWTPVCAERCSALCAPCPAWRSMQGGLYARATPLFAPFSLCWRALSRMSESAENTAISTKYIRRSRPARCRLISSRLLSLQTLTACQPWLATRRHARTCTRLQRGQKMGYVASTRRIYIETLSRSLKTSGQRTLAKKPLHRDEYSRPGRGPLAALMAGDVTVLTDALTSRLWRAAFFSA